MSEPTRYIVAGFVLCAISAFVMGVALAALVGLMR